MCHRVYAELAVKVRERREATPCRRKSEISSCCNDRSWLVGVSPVLHAAFTSASMTLLCLVRPRSCMYEGHFSDFALGSDSISALLAKQVLLARFITAL